MLAFHPPRGGEVTKNWNCASHDVVMEKLDFEGPKWDSGEIASD